MLAAMKSIQPNNHWKLRKTTWRALLGCGLALGLAASGTGCKPETKVEPKAAAGVNTAGTYTLVSVDGNNVPCAVKHEGKDGLTVKSGSFVLNADGTCSSKVVFTAPNGTDATREVKATYTQDGSKLTMKWEGAGTTSGTVADNSFNMNNEGMIFAYRK
jgi:hypothetical protein